MNSGYRYILYSLLGLAAAGAILFLIFGKDILAGRQAAGDLQAWLKELQISPVVDVPEGLLEHPVLAGLTNYSPTFNMEEICVRPKSGPASQVPACRLGNSQPFQAEKK